MQSYKDELTGWIATIRLNVSRRFDLYMKFVEVDLVTVSKR